MSKRKDTLLMETTEVAAARTAGEIIAQLVAIGASEINQSFKDGKITGIRWALSIHGRLMFFEMPVRTRGVYQILQSRRPPGNRASAEQADQAKAERIAWRQLLRWVQAQIAMIQTGMAQASEVFLPYLWDPATQRTLFEWMDDRQFKALPAAETKQ